MKKPFFSFLLICLSLASLAQFSLIKDINPGSATSNISYLTTIGNTLFFGADDGVHGMEIWRSDGTNSGTILIKDINSGVGSSSIGYLTNVNGVLFFVADDGINGPELWKSDGTATGTYMVKNIRTGSMGSYPSDLINVNGVLYFAADDGINGTELWKSDGTASGTVMVRNIKAGSEGSNVRFLAQLNGKVFFAADNGTNGMELWKSNGTSAGTTMVKDIWSGGFESYPMSLTTAGSYIYFVADNGANGNELWKTDGTANGTVMVKDIYAGAESSSPYNLKAINDQLFFSANNGVNGIELWKSDGTTPGTALVKDIWPGAQGGTTGQFSQLINSLVFTGNDGITGDKTWQSDGSSAGTRISTLLNVENGVMRELEETQTKIFASIDQTGVGGELWGVSYSSVLPMEVFSFNGKDVEGTISLEWYADTDKNSKYFAVERSTNGRDFQEIGRVTSQSTGLLNTYFFNDKMVDRSGVENIFYRIRQVDVFDRFVYSRILRFTTNLHAQLALYPNPAFEQISLGFTLAGRQEISYQVADCLGKTVLRSERTLEKGIHTISININQLQSGVYFIRFDSDNRSTSLRFIKQ